MTDATIVVMQTTSPHTAMMTGIIVSTRPIG
jgi:hypothetical protein